MADADGDQIVVTAVGAVSAVGANAKNTCAAIKAGIVPFQEHDYVRGTPHDPEWDEDLPINVARVPFINGFENSIERFHAMVVPVLTEVIAQSGINRQALARTGLLLALPVSDPGLSDIAIGADWLTHVQRATGLGGLAFANTHDDGRIGTFALMSEASDMLRAGQLDHCIVGGIDSYLFEKRMAYFDQKWRVKTVRNVDGFVPGEAAAMLMLETKSNTLSRAAAPLAKIDGLGFAMEPVDLASTRASSGEGLTQAIRQALSAGDSSAQKDVQRVHCGLNGESYFAYEWGVVHTRLGHILPNIRELQHPADSVGEVGAALSSLMAVNAVSILAKSKTPESILVFAANDDPRRSALLLTTS